MDAFLGFFSFIQGLGVSVMMPIVLTILGCILGAGFGKSLRAELTVGVGFIGLGLVINSLLGTTLSPAVQEMVNRFGLSLTVVDVGWPAAAAIAMGSTVGLIIIPLGLVVNIVMLLTNTTQTVDVDIWDYWHFAFTGALVSIVTNSYVFGIIAAILNMIVIMVLGDYTAPLVEESLQMPGVSLPHGFTTAYAPIAMLFNWIFDKIPGVRDIDINTDTLQKKFGVFGEPILVGTVIGLVIGVLAYWDGGNVAASIDSAVGVGHPVTLAISFILVPLCIFLAVILPGNKVLPFADLAVIPWMFVLITPVVRNNGFRGIFIGLIVLTVGLYIATDLSPLITTAASNVQFDMGGAAAISSICDGANPLTWLIVRIGGIANGLGLAIIGIATLALAIWNKRRIHKEALELHTSDTAE